MIQSHVDVLLQGHSRPGEVSQPSSHVLQVRPFKCLHNELIGMLTLPEHTLANTQQSLLLVIAELYKNNKLKLEIYIPTFVSIHHKPHECDQTIWQIATAKVRTVCDNCVAQLSS